MRWLPLVLMFACQRTPPESAASVDPLDQPLPIDVLVRRGVLDNGMHFYLERNTQPQNKAVLRLAVDAGSLLEDDDQLGVAHFLEHMAFNGTTSFPGNEVITYLESVGTQFGPHLNAHTSFDETVYKLTVPTDDAEVFDTGLRVLQEWACCLTLDPEEIEKERGVVLEEWRLRQGLSQRMTDVTMPLNFGDSRYVARLPIGTPESLKTFDPAVVARFYRDWYRPDLMAIIVAGDIDLDAVEAQIRERFGAVPAPQGGRERLREDVPEPAASEFVVFADPELTRTGFNVSTRFDDHEAETLRDWRRFRLGQVALGALNERLAELSRDPAAPFLGLGTSASLMTPREGVHTAGVGAKDGRSLEAIERLLLEVKRFREYGVTAPELARAKANILETMDKYEREAEDTDSTVAADEIVRHFLTGETMPGTAVEAQLTRDVLQTISLDDVNAWAAKFLEGPATHFLSLPEKGEIPTAADLQAVVAKVDAAVVEPPESQEAPERLLPTPSPGTVSDRDDRWLQSMGFEGRVLSNGVHVYTKKTDLKAGEVLLSGWRRGGLDAVSDGQYRSGQAADNIRSNSGVGEFDRGAVSRYLNGRTVSARLSIGGDLTSVGGSSSTRDLQIALELLHAYQTSPAFTTVGTDLALNGWRESLINAKNSPDQQFNDAWNPLYWPKDPRKQAMQLSDVDEVQLPAAQQIYEAAVGDPSEWTYVMVGDLPDDVESIINTWLGSLPSAKPGLVRTDRNSRRQPGAHREELKLASAERARFRTEWWVPVQAEVYDRPWRIRLDAFGDVLKVLLRERLREDMGGVYGVSVSSSSWDWPYYGASVRVDFSCDPERLPELEAAMADVMAQVQKEGVEQRYIDAQKAKNREWYEDSMQRNSRWMGGFSSALQNDEDPSDMLNYLQYNDTITADSVQAFAKQLLSSPNRATLVLLPREE
jgi:zinc protease